MFSFPYPFSLRQKRHRPNDERERSRSVKKSNQISIVELAPSSYLLAIKNSKLNNRIRQKGEGEEPTHEDRKNSSASRCVNCEQQHHENCFKYFSRGAEQCATWRFHGFFSAFLRVFNENNFRAKKNLFFLTSQHQHKAKKREKKRAASERY